MNKKVKRIVCIVVSCALILISAGGTCVQQARVTAEQSEQLIKLTQREIRECVIRVSLAWAKAMKPTLDLQAGEVRKIGLTTGIGVEYTVSYFLGCMPYGYAVVLFNDHDVMVKDARIASGQEGLYTALVHNAIEQTGTSRSELEIDNILLELSPTQYSISLEDKNKNQKTIDNYGNVYDEKSENDESTKYAKVESIYIEKKNWVKSKYKVDEAKTITLNKYLKRSVLFKEQEIISYTGRYCCVTQALLQIAYMEGLIKEKNPTEIKRTQNKLWKYCKVTETAESKKNKSSDKVIYGESNIQNANKGFVKYAKEKGKKGTEEKTIQNNPKISWIKNKLEYNRPVLMKYGININGKRSGHQISVLGYQRAKKVSSGNTWDYLMVYNSWDDTVNYLNYSTVDFMDCAATYFWVK